MPSGRPRGEPAEAAARATGRRGPRHSLPVQGTPQARLSPADPREGTARTTRNWPELGTFFPAPHRCTSRGQVVLGSGDHPASVQRPPLTRTGYSSGAPREPGLTTTKCGKGPDQRHQQLLLQGGGHSSTPREETPHTHVRAHTHTHARTQARTMNQHTRNRKCLESEGKPEPRCTMIYYLKYPVFKKVKICQKPKQNKNQKCNVHLGKSSQTLSKYP